MSPIESSITALSITVNQEPTLYPYYGRIAKNILYHLKSDGYDDGNNWELCIRQESKRLKSLSTKYVNEELLRIIKDFLFKYKWDEDHVPEQVRSLFTTICITDNLNADTKKVDEVLSYLYYKTDVRKSLTYQQFENFMLEFII